MYSNYPDSFCDAESRCAIYKQPDRVMADVIRSDTIDEIELLERKLDELYQILRELDEAAD